MAPTHAREREDLQFLRTIFFLRTFSNVTCSQLPDLYVFLTKDNTAKTKKQW